MKETIIMGVLNMTPDSFSDGNQYNTLDKAIKHTNLMCQAGAGIIDVGGESSRPDATPISIDEELARTLPIIEAIHKRFDVQISIDTTKPKVMQASIAAGANLINDISEEKDISKTDIKLLISLHINEGKKHLLITTYNLSGNIIKVMQFDEVFGEEAMMKMMAK